MIDEHTLSEYRWYFGPGQVRFRPSPVTAMMERTNMYTKGAILDAKLEYGMPGKRQTFYGADAGKKAGKFKGFIDKGERTPILGSSGQVLAHHPAETVHITAESRGGPAPTSDDEDHQQHEETKRYGRCSSRMFALNRIDPMHALVFEAYCGPLGETYNAGILVPEVVKKERKPKKGKPELTTGVEVKEKVETEIIYVRRKGPGRIAALYHLTPSGRALLDPKPKEALAAEAPAPAKKKAPAARPETRIPEVAMRELITSPPADDIEYRAAMERIPLEAADMLAAAVAAHTEVVASSPRAD